MRLEWHIARRYLFGKKHSNAINIITGLSMLGIAIGTAALFLVLSVFNGFEDILGEMVSRFNPDIKVVAAEGKFIDRADSLVAVIEQQEGVLAVSRSLEEVALFRYVDNMQFGVIKGVDTLFSSVAHIDSAMIDGQYSLRGDNGEAQGVFGVGMAGALMMGAGPRRGVTPVAVYMPRKKKRGPLDKPFKTLFLEPSGVFSIQQEIDNQYVLAPLDFVERLLNTYGKCNSIEVRLEEGVGEEQAMKWLASQLGPDFEVKDRHKQDEAYYKLMRIEKWMFFALFALMMLLVAFNIIGALWMIVLSKQQDIAIFKAMGATDDRVRNIFLVEGVLISVYGLIIGLVLGMILYVLQQEVGLVEIPAGFVIDSYPLSFKWADWIVVSATVLSIGFLASILPALRAERISLTQREK